MVTWALSARAVAGHRGLDLAGGVEVHVDVAFGGRERDHAAGLRGPHRGVRVLVGEHPLDRDDVWQMGVHPVVDGVADRQQAAVQRLVGRCPNHVDVQRDDLTAPTALHDGQSAAGQPRIDTHHPHPRLPCRTSVRYLSGPHRQRPVRHAATNRFGSGFWPSRASTIA